MNIRRFIIYFFYFFLFSRFFSENLKLLPKYIDLINYPITIIVLILLFININKNYSNNNVEYKLILKLIWIFIVGFLISALLNANTVLFPAVILFILGFLEGPILFLVLTKIIEDKLALYKDIYKLFTVLIFINMIVVFIYDLPLFIISGNPDVMSGTYGLNAAQFSILLVIASGLVTGKFFIENRSAINLLIIQLIIFLIYFSLQYRAAIPMYIITVFILISIIYGKNILKYSIVGALFLFLIYFVSTTLIEKEEKAENLKYNAWYEIMQNPSYFATFGKIKVYFNTIDMFSEYPETIFFGVGPGNYLSRANYAFSIELKLSFEKGVGPIIRDVFGIKYPNYTFYAEKYVNPLRYEFILGTWQLGNPNSSYLSPVAEIGILGLSIIFIYIYATIKSYNHILILRRNNSKYLPFAVAAFGGFLYLLYLGILDNWWETARMTLPVWLLFWASSNISNDILNNEQKNQNIIVD